MLIELIDDYLRHARMTPTRFGREVVGDPNFVLNLRHGRRPRTRTIRRVTKYIEANAPHIEAAAPRFSLMESEMAS